MNAAARQAQTDDTVPARHGEQSFVVLSSLQRLELLARLAAFWARPIDFVDASYVSVQTLSAASVIAMGQNTFFCRPANRAVGDALGLPTRAISPALLDQIMTSQPHRLLVLLLTAPIAQVQAIGIALAAAILSPRITALILKADRLGARAALGDSAFRLAVEEAPLMYGGLAELDLKIPGRGLLPAGASTEVSALEFSRFATAALARLCDALAPDLTDLFSLRYAADPVFDERARFLGGFNGSHVDLAMRLIRRKEPSWLATIA